MTKYPTPWQRKTMWAALTAFFIVVLITIACSLVWLVANLVGFLQPILIPVAIAVILAYLLDPLVTKMSAGRLGRTKAVFALFAIAFLSIGALVAWLAPVVSMQATNVGRELPQYTLKARDTIVDLIFKYDHAFGGPSTGSKRDKVSSPTSNLLNWIFAAPTPVRKPTPTPAPPAPDASAPPEVAAAETPPPRDEIAPMPDKISTADRQRIQAWVQRQLPNLERQLPYFTEKIWNLLKQSIGGFLGVTGFLLSLVMVPIYLFFLLKESPAIERRWREYLPLRASPLKDEVAAVLSQINNYVIAYFRGQLLVCLIDGILIGVALYLFGLNFAPLIGLLVVVLTMIPYIGIILCWIPAVLIAAGQWGDWGHPITVTLVFIVVQNLEALFIAPRIVGNSVGLHPMTVIVSIFIWGLLIGGLLGPILAVPLTATIKVLLARYVWGRRLREKVADAVDDVPVVRRAESTA
ncbi:MAG TPA: AI-2E family transporter [Chthoniobacterales bacterium]|jgi:predicted PurR-regulated permease PerM|nr:AI-2E family transporter [Chthoniobacterales bacterium]